MASHSHPALQKVEQELTCPICLDTAQLPVNFVCFKGCGGRFAAGATCLRSVLCTHCANEALQLGRPPAERFAGQGGAAFCLICRTTAVDARSLTPESAYAMNHNVMSIMDALAMGGTCRRCDEECGSQAALLQHYQRRCPAAIVRCRFRGCASWHPRAAAAAHEDCCPVGRCRCSQCGCWVDRPDLLRHTVSTCRLRVVSCVLCGHTARLPDMLEHLRLHQSHLQGQGQGQGQLLQGQPGIALGSLQAGSNPRESRSGAGAPVVSPAAATGAPAGGGAVEAAAPGGGGAAAGPALAMVRRQERALEGEGGQREGGRGGEGAGSAHVEAAAAAPASQPLQAQRHPDHPALLALPTALAYQQQQTQGQGQAQGQGQQQQQAPTLRAHRALENFVAGFERARQEELGGRRLAPPPGPPLRADTQPPAPADAPAPRRLRPPQGFLLQTALHQQPQFTYHHQLHQGPQALQQQQHLPRQQQQLQQLQQLQQQQQQRLQANMSTEQQLQQQLALLEQLLRRRRQQLDQRLQGQGQGPSQAVPGPPRPPGQEQRTGPGAPPQTAPRAGAVNGAAAAEAADAAGGPAGGAPSSRAQGQGSRGMAGPLAASLALELLRSGVVGAPGAGVSRAPAAEAGGFTAGAASAYAGLVAVAPAAVLHMPVAAAMGAAAPAANPGQEQGRVEAPRAANPSPAAPTAGPASVPSSSGLTSGDPAPAAANHGSDDGGAGSTRSRGGGSGGGGERRGTVGGLASPDVVPAGLLQASASAPGGVQRGDGAGGGGGDGGAGFDERVRRRAAFWLSNAVGALGASVPQPFQGSQAGSGPRGSDAGTLDGGGGGNGEVGGGGSSPPVERVSPAVAGTGPVLGAGVAACGPNREGGAVEGPTGQQPQYRSDARSGPLPRPPAGGGGGVLPPRVRRSFSDTELVYDVLEELVRASAGMGMGERAGARASMSGV